jgi:hypothetical protein
MDDYLESTISPEQYARWITPSDAIELLPEDWGRGKIVDALTRELENGGIRSAARRGLIRSEGAETVLTYCLIDKIFWSERRWSIGTEDLWLTGQLSFHQGISPAWSILRKGSNPWVEHSFSGVRFHPEDLSDAFSVETISKNQPLGQPIAPAELKRFVELYLGIWGDASTEGKALDAARACYREKSIGRDPFREVFRELRGPGKPGKPASRGK